MKIRIGLNSYKVAQLMKDISAEAAEDGTAAVKYKEIVSMPDVQNIDLTARSQSADVDADDISTTLSKCSGYDGKVQRTAFTPIDQAMLLGETILEDGTVVSSPKDEAPEFATGFICPVHGGSFLAMWVLRCKYATPDFSAETAGTEKLNPQSDTISFKSSSRASDDKYYNDWENHNDTPEDVYARIKERNDTELLAGHITDEEYNDNMTEAGQKLYEGRLKNSKKWLEMQKKYGAITEEEYREGLARIKAYTEDYYRRGMISGQFYYDALDDANSDLFDNMQSSLENYLNEYYEAQKEMLSARRTEIEAEYDALEKSEKKANRLQELKDLQSQYAKYQNAVTIEGKKKLKEIQDNIDGLKKEERDEIRNEEKQSRLDELNKESESIEKEQENSLKGISKYTAQALGIISGGNDEMIVKFNKIVENYNSQQATLAQSGYDTISKIVDMTNVKLAELGQNLQPQQSGGGDVKVSVTQTFHNQITDDVSAQAYGKFASRSVNNLNWLEMFNKNGGMK